MTEADVNTDKEKLARKMDRIRLAMALGWTPAEEYSDNHEWRGMAFTPEGSGPRPWPDPFTDASHDYAVLEWMRKNKEDIESKMKGGGWWMVANIGNEESIYSKDYRVGDYARAALRVLENN